MAKPLFRAQSSLIAQKFWPPIWKGNPAPAVSLYSSVPTAVILRI